VPVHTLHYGGLFSSTLGHFGLQIEFTQQCELPFNVAGVAEGAARVLATCPEPWAREAIEESFIDDEVKREPLG
jgi:hypothetical protein